MKDEEDKKEDFGVRFAKFCLTATHNIFNWVLRVGCIVFAAFVFTKMWGWFVVPRFNLPSIDLPTAGGLMMLASFPLSYRMFATNIQRALDATSPNTSTATDTTIINLAYGALIVPTTLLIAYLWSLLLP